MRVFERLFCRRRAWQMLASIGIGSSIASPAMADSLCGPGWPSPYCYSVMVQGGALSPTEHMPNYSYQLSGTPISIATPYSTISGGASASATDANNGTLLVSASVQNFGYTSHASATLSYNFRLQSIAGSPLDALVPLHVSALAESLRDSSSGADEYASFFMSQDGVQLIFKYAYTPLNRVTTMFTIDDLIWVKPDTDIYLDMGASAIANPNIETTRIVSGVRVDPVFEIGADYAARYTIVGLPLGSGSPPVDGAVPEPATWAMLLVGFGLVGGSMRRRSGLKANAREV